GRDLRGWRFVADGTPPDGFPVDGTMDDAERAFEAHGDWFLLGHGKDALLFVTRMSENLSRQIRLNLVYRDDAERPNPPEGSPGTVPLVGLEGEHVEKLPGGRYTFHLGIYQLDAWRDGAARRELAAIDAPVGYEVATDASPAPDEAADPRGAAPPAPR